MKRRLLDRLLRTALFRRISFTIALGSGAARVRVPIINGIGLAYFDPHELWLDRVLEVLMRSRPGLFIDVGMNLGQTLIKVKTIDRAQAVLGFEPNATCVTRIEELIRLNDYQGVRVLPVALSDHDHLAELQLYGKDPSDGSASMVKGFRPGSIWRVDRIVCLGFDTVERSIPIERIGVVKIDVEGAESFVLAGMSARLRKDRPLVVMEILPVWDAKNTDRLERQQAVERLMGELDYRIVRILAEDGEAIRLEPISEIGVHDQMQWTNYLLLPSEMLDTVERAMTDPHRAATVSGKATVPGALSS